MPHYKPIGPNKWLKIEEDKLVGEDGHVTYYHEIVISLTDPNRRDSIKKYNTTGYNCQE